MKRFLLRLSIALLTFFVSWAITSVFVFFIHLPEVKAVSEAEGFACPIPYISENDVEILYNWESMKRNKKKGSFLITNRFKQSIYYLAYEKNQHFDNWIRQNGKLKGATDFICHMGMKLQELKPNESQLFEINIPRNKKPFEAGFDFFIGKEQKAKTFWVNVNKESNYNPLP